MKLLLIFYLYFNGLVKHNPRITDPQTICVRGMHGNKYKHAPGTLMFASRQHKENDKYNIKNTVMNTYKTFRSFLFPSSVSRNVAGQKSGSKLTLAVMVFL